MLLEILKYLAIAVTTFFIMYKLECEEVGTLVMTVAVPLTVYACTLN